MTDTRPRLSATCDYLGEGRWCVSVWEENDSGIVDPVDYVIKADADKEQSAAFQAMDRYIAEMNDAS